jgi:tRNA-binding protein
MSIPPLLPVVPAEDFFAVDICVGRIISARVFPEAKKPAYIVEVDFGPVVGTLRTSAQITVHYTPEILVGRLVLGWVNAHPKQIGSFISQFLLLGAHDENGAVVLIDAPAAVPLGSRMC